MISTLQDGDSGGFFGSQDAQEAYYKSGRIERRKQTTPSIDRTVYAGGMQMLARRSSMQALG